MSEWYVRFGGRTIPLIAFTICNDPERTLRAATFTESTVDVFVVSVRAEVVSTDQLETKIAFASA